MSPPALVGTSLCVSVMSILINSGKLKTKWVYFVHIDVAPRAKKQALVGWRGNVDSLEARSPPAY